MIRLQWNALRVGDHVLVHDESDTDMSLVPGRVTAIETAPGSNEVTIRITPKSGPAKVVQPSRLLVHLDEFDPDGRCWRCDMQSPVVRRPTRPVRAAPAAEPAT